MCRIAKSGLFLSRRGRLGGGGGGCIPCTALPRTLLILTMLIGSLAGLHSRSVPPPVSLQCLLTLQTPHKGMQPSFAWCWRCLGTCVVWAKATRMRSPSVHSEQLLARLRGATKGIAGLRPLLLARSPLPDCFSVQATLFGAFWPMSKGYAVTEACQT